ncbi:MAG: signal recognition particle-docking protein FtsY [candidate division WOR-3 bacterium]
MGLREKLAKTRQIFSRLFSPSGPNIDDLEAALLSADVGVKATQLLLAAVRRAPNHPREALKEEIVTLLSSTVKAQPLPLEKPTVIMVVGVNGSGKTTTVGKLSHYYSQMGKRVVVAASDTYRDAAADQLGIWAERAGVEVIRSQKGQDAAAVAFDAVTRAVQQGFDIVLIDTAGRLHTRKDLMAEAEKIKRVCGKVKSGAPDEVWLVLDATVGQNGIRQAQIFNQELGLTGLIITKLDGTAKGGVLVPVIMDLGLPVRFIGTGEGIEDLEPFDPETYARALIED